MHTRVFEYAVTTHEVELGSSDQVEALAAAYQAVELAADRFAASQGRRLSSRPFSVQYRPGGRHLLFDANAHAWFTSNNYLVSNNLWFDGEPYPVQAHVAVYSVWEED